MPAGGHTAARDDEAVRHFVEHLAMSLTDWGFPRMAARVLVVMMAAEEDTLGASDLADRLGVSPAAISGAVRYLMHVGILERAPAPGSRRDAYRLPDEGWYVASLERQRAYITFATIADDGVRALGGDGTTAGARVAQMRDFFRFVQANLTDLLQRWEKEKAARERISLVQRAGGPRPEPSRSARARPPPGGSR